MSTHRLFPSVSGPSTPVAYSGNFVAGVVFAVSGGGNWFEGYWFWVCNSGQETTPVKCALWQSAPVNNEGNGFNLIAGSVVTSGTLTAGAWNYVPLDEPVPLAPSYAPDNPVNGSAYVAAIGINGPFPDTFSQFGPGDPYADGITSGPLVAYSGPSGSNPAPYVISQGIFSVAGTDPSQNIPTQPDTDGDGNSNLWVDVQVSDTAPAGYSGTYRLWPNKMDSNASTVADSAVAYSVATEIDLAQTCVPSYVHYFVPADAAPGAGFGTSVRVWDIASQTSVLHVTSPAWLNEDGTAANFADVSDGLWVKCETPATQLPAARYRVSVYNANGAEGGWNAKDASTGYFTTGVAANGIANGPVTAPNLASAASGTFYPGTGTGATTAQPVFAYDGTDDFPDVTTGDNPPQVYWVDLEVTPVAVPPPVVSPSGYSAPVPNHTALELHYKAIHERNVQAARDAFTGVSKTPKSG